MDLTVVELFAGVGGFRVGLNKITDFDKNTGKAIENGDWKFVWANQYEPSTKIQYAYECYKQRFDNNISNVDINKVNKRDIPNHSLLVGGFPCQDYSVARSLSSEKGIEGKKGVLFWDIKDVLVSKKTPFVLLENVDRLLKSPSTRRGRDFAIMLKTFDELGYNVQWRVINSSNYSMPQKRKRVFIFAYRKELKYNKKIKIEKLNLENDNLFNEVFPVDEVINLEKINLNVYKDTLDISNNFSYGKFLETGVMIEGNVIHAQVKSKQEHIYSLKRILDESKKYNNSLDSFIVKNEKIDKWKYLKGSKKIERISNQGHKYIYSEGQMSFPENIDEPARTILTSEGTMNRSSHIVYDDEIKSFRILTPIECELIQMFPPDWTNMMPKNRNRYFMMGNALVTGIVRRLEPKIKEIIEREK